jgi:hypothetical protein
MKGKKDRVFWKEKKIREKCAGILKFSSLINFMLLDLDMQKGH